MIIFRLLIFLPYFFIPLILAIFYKRKNLIKSWVTYLVTGIAITLYPFLLLWIDNRDKVDTNGKYIEIKCLLPEFSLVFGHVFVLMPICLIIQFVFNRIIKAKKSLNTLNQASWNGVVTPNKNAQAFTRTFFIWKGNAILVIKILIRNSMTALIPILS